MATKNEPPPPPAADAPAPKRKLGKLLIIAGLAAVLLIGGGTAAFLLLSKDEPVDEEDVEVDEKPKKKKEKEEHKPSYTTLEPFTVNLASETGDQFLQVSLTLDMNDPAAAEKAKTYLAKIRNDVMLHLSGKKPAEIASKEGKQVLAAELRDLINAILDPGWQTRKGEKGQKGTGMVKEVLFTSFIIQ